MDMNNENSDENYDDEFECSECDFKCLSEDDMIEHSAIHTESDPLSDVTCNGINNKDNTATAVNINCIGL